MAGDACAKFERAERVQPRICGRRSEHSPVLLPEPNGSTERCRLSPVDVALSETIAIISNYSKFINTLIYTEYIFDVTVNESMRAYIRHVLCALR